MRQSPTSTQPPDAIQDLDTRGGNGICAREFLCSRSAEHQRPEDNVRQLKPQTKFYVVFSTNDLTALNIAPDNAAAYSRVRVITVGPVSPRWLTQAMPVRLPNASGRYALLWTLGPDNIWRRSPCYELREARPAAPPSLQRASTVSLR